MEPAFDVAIVLRPGRASRPNHGKDAPMILLPRARRTLGMLAAPGTSVLRNTYVINRGYEELAERLNALGAKIETFRD